MSDPAMLKKQIIKFTSDYYSQNEDIPSIGSLKKSFAISNSEFYAAFPGGIVEFAGHATFHHPKE